MAIPPLHIRPGTTPATVARQAPRFQADSNGKAGQAYTGKIARADGRPVQLRAMHLPDTLDLTFNAADASLTGTPLVAGEHELQFEWSENGLEWQDGRCVLIVNPDPRTLWRVNEPAAELPYRKPHLDGKRIGAPLFRMAAASRRGRSHEHAGGFREDDCFLHYGEASGWAVMIVADGAGSAPSSRWGSKLAVEAAGSNLVPVLSGAEGAALAALVDSWDSAASQAVGERFHYLFHGAATAAVQAIDHEALAQGAPVRDYATTLLACAVRRQGDALFVATFWMGDGAIAAYGPRGKVRLMGAPDGGEFAGQTRFLDHGALADAAFARRIRIGKYDGLDAVLLLTDGVSDARFETDNALSDGARWDALWDEMAPHLAAPDADQQLLGWLDFFTPGHHDDRTIAVLW